MNIKPNNNLNAVVLLSAGNGERLNSNVPKQYLPTNNNLTVLEESLITFLNNPLINFIQPVISSEHLSLYNSIIKKFSNNKKLLPAIYGGATRADSVFNALQTLRKYMPNKVLIHDSARPFVQKHIIDNILNAIEPKIGVVSAVPIADTIKRANDNVVYSEEDRTNLFSVQTPQGFIFNEILLCYTKFKDQKLTDDSSYFIKNNYQIKLIEGNLLNSKVTYKQDLENLKRLNYNYSDNSPSYEYINLVGFGVDIHAFSLSKEDNQILFLGGVEIPYTTGLKAHSDGDVVIHAIVDAILGALSEGDIGEHFKDTDERWSGADSREFLSFTKYLLKKHNAVINNLDIAIMAEQPKLMDYKQLIKEEIAFVLNIDSKRVNIKATTAEKLGAIGNKEGIKCYCVASITKYLDATDDML